jgi:hypothetical protein
MSKPSKKSTGSRRQAVVTVRISNTLYFFKSNREGFKKFPVDYYKYQLYIDPVSFFALKVDILKVPETLEIHHLCMVIPSPNRIDISTKPAKA